MTVIAALTTRKARVMAAGAAGLTALVIGLMPTNSSVAAAPHAQPSTALSTAGTWLTDSQGRAVILHGLNEVFKVPPYEPSASGFSDDDAAFLQANGFNAMRVGVIWAAVEPQPGVYDNGYLASIAQTVQTLSAHGIVSLLDFHQDLYNEKFQGEGAPAWAVQDGGLPNPALGFPWNYFGNLAEENAWDSFWRNAKASDGVGLQDHYAKAWAHVASAFTGNPAVFGYEILNEPWPGTAWEPCAVPGVGCKLFDGPILTKFYQRVTTAIRHVDPATPIFYEPNTLLSTVDTTQLGTVSAGHMAFAFHDYCGPAAIGLGSQLCGPIDDLTVASAKAYMKKHNLPWLLTEFGATNDVSNLSEVVALADKNMLGWLEWAYTGNDKTSSSPNGQALVFDPTQPPTGTNVNTAKLQVLAEPYPQAVAGTPTAYSFSGGVFTLTYSSTRPAGSGHFPAGSVTNIAVPAVQYPAGYTVSVTGGSVASAPDAATLQIASAAGATTITVTVRP